MHEQRIAELKAQLDALVERLEKVEREMAELRREKAMAAAR